MDKEACKEGVGEDHAGIRGEHCKRGIARTKTRASWLQWSWEEKYSDLRPEKLKKTHTVSGLERHVTL